MQNIKIHITSRFSFLVKHSVMPAALLILLVNKILVLFWCHSSITKISLFSIHGKDTANLQQATVCHLFYISDTDLISSAKQIKREKSISSWCNAWYTLDCVWEERAWNFLLKIFCWDSDKSLILHTWC